MKSIAITGANGLVGSALTPLLTASGHTVTRIVRAAKARENDIGWDVDTQTIDAAKLEGHDAVVHLAGENIAGYWSAAKKKRILDSRVKSTALIARSLAGLQRKPKVLVCASATGAYGHRGDELLTDDSPRGTGFLADVCREWEAAAQPAIAAGIRTVFLRIGIVLAADGGALKSMLLPFKLCLGGVVGGGAQYWSWISLDDVLGVIQHCLHTDSLQGPVNAVVPTPATNREFTKTLGRVLNRPTPFPVPAFVLRTLLGEMADALLLSSIRVVPQRLESSGYVFRFPELEGAMRHALGRPAI